MKKKIKIFYNNIIDEIENEINERRKMCVDDWRSSYINIGYKRALERSETIIKEVFTIFKEAEKHPKNNEEAIIISYDSFIADIIKRIVYEFSIVCKLKDNPKMVTYYTGYTSGLKMIKKIIVRNYEGNNIKRVERAIESGNYQILLADEGLRKEREAEA